MNRGYKSVSALNLLYHLPIHSALHKMEFDTRDMCAGGQGDASCEVNAATVEQEMRVYQP